MNLYPARKDTSDQQKAASIAAITDISDAVQSGLSWGQSVADQIWAWRSQDGFPVTDAGQRRPAPPAMGAWARSATGYCDPLDHSPAFAIPSTRSERLGDFPVLPTCCGMEISPDGRKLVVNSPVVGAPELWAPNR